MDTMPMATLPDNAALAWMIAKDRPHYSPATLAKAVRIENKRDTLGRKRAERTRRAAWTADCDRCEPQAEPLGNAELVTALVSRLKSAGLEVLIPALSDGLSIREACAQAGLSKSTVCDRLAIIRAQLTRELNTDSE